MKVNRYNLSDIGAHISSGLGSAGSFIPEPRNRNSMSFSSVLESTFQAVSGVASEVGSSLVGIDPKYASLLELQMKNQEQMQLVSLISNNEKAKHETYMAPVRNIKVG